MTTLFGPFAGLHPDWFVVQSVTDFFSSTFADLKDAVTDQNILGILTNPYIIVFSALFVLLAFLQRSSKPFLLPFAMWGYGLSWHFSLGRTDVDVTNYMDTDTTRLVPMVLFVVGFVFVTAVILYLWSQDGT